MDFEEMARAVANAAPVCVFCETLIDQTNTPVYGSRICLRCETAGYDFLSLPN
jgi:hypothetical protein